jgi:ABC-type multidrug transport system fused ATPase/permease subunit
MLTTIGVCLVLLVGMLLIVVRRRQLKIKRKLQEELQRTVEDVSSKCENLMVIHLAGGHVDFVNDPVRRIESLKKWHRELDNAIRLVESL